MRENSTEGVEESSQSKSSTASSPSESETFYTMKQRLLADRTEQMALGMLEQLLSHRVDEISWLVR